MMARKAMALLALAFGASSTDSSPGGTMVINGASLGSAPASDVGVLAPAPATRPLVAPVAPVAPEVVPAPSQSVIAPVVECSTYMAQTTCQWTEEYSCPGQPLGSKGTAVNDNTDGYKCCCLQGLWQTIDSTASGPTPAPVAPVVSPGAAGPTHNNHPLAKESIPRSVQLKHKLIQWFESTSQCPLNEEGGFPAWVGWKAVTAAAPAVTTPPKGIAGNRTMRVSGFCPVMNSQSFTCVKENGELKARAKENLFVSLDIDQLSCNMRDISVYRLDSHLGVRFDFADCQTVVLGEPTGALPPHVGIKTASMNAGLQEETVAPGDSQEVGFTEFMTAVCTPGSANKMFVTANLPKFARSNNNGLLTPDQAANSGNATNAQPTCFSETANTAHVLGKGCFDDFLFFDLQDLNGNLAKIPAQDLQTLDAMVTKNQHSNKPHSVPSPVPGTPGPAMIAIPAPTPSPVPVENTNPCAPQLGTTKPPSDSPCKPQKPTCESYVCPSPWTPRPNPGHFLCKAAGGCTVLDRPICCILGTTQTTTVFVPEVPGVVIADRVCIEWRNCGNCNNLCDCLVRPPVSDTTTTSPLIPVVPVCEDYSWETLIIALFSVLIVGPLCCWCHERCIAPWAHVQSKEDNEKAIKAGKYKPSAGMTYAMNSMTGSMGTAYNATFSSGCDPSDLRTIQATTFKSSYVGWYMAGLNFISTAVISFVFVHVVYWVWNFIMWMVMGIWRDLVWNAIDIQECWRSLFPLCIALWLMNWLSLVYFYGWGSYSYTVEVCETPVSVEVNGSMQQGGSWGAW